NRIVDLLAQGIIPWRRPWTVQKPLNLVSGKSYRGINVFTLSSAPYTSPYWLTFRQAQERGGHVRKGERGMPIVFWKIVEKDDEIYPVLQSWTVFNVQQCDGIAYPALEVPTFDPIAAAENVAAQMPNAPTITHDGGSRAFYRPR